MITLQDVQRGYDAWAAKPHNAKWVRKIDGTPIPNDIVVNIFEALKDGGQSIAHKDGCDFKHSPITLCDCPASKDGGQEVGTGVFENGEMVGFIGIGDEFNPDPERPRVTRPIFTTPQPASTALVERLTKALNDMLYAPNQIEAREKALSALSASTSREGESQ